MLSSNRGLQHLKHLAIPVGCLISCDRSSNTKNTLRGWTVVIGNDSLCWIVNRLYMFLCWDTIGNENTRAVTIFNNSCLRYLTALGHKHCREKVLTSLLSVPEISYHLNTDFLWRLLSHWLVWESEKSQNIRLLFVMLNIGYGLNCSCK